MQLRIACNGLVETLGRVYSGQVDHAFTAHPKIDPVTGEMFFFGYNVSTKPHLWYSRTDAAGKITADFPVELPEGIMAHDFAITEKSAIFLDVPLVFTPEAMVKERRLPFTYRKDRPARFGVLDRYAKDASTIRWFSTEPCMIFHVCNAWEEGDVIELYACCFNNFSLDTFNSVKDSDPYLSRIVLNLKTGETQYYRLSPVPGDFPAIPVSLVGRKTRYGYVGAMEPNDNGIPRFIGAAKIDLAAAGQGDSLKGILYHGDGRLGGEAFFVPAAGGTEEDDGYLMTFVHDDVKEESQLVIYDAKTMSSKPVTVLKMPQRVPHGFHCTWVTEEQMKELNAAA
jgi:carotenoid cleavage dioxygenase-like enzyme